MTNGRGKGVAVTIPRSPHSAVVFPGQGSQRVGMARDFHDRFPVSRRTFEEASDALGLDVATLCFEDGDRLDQTEFTQPALVTAEIAMMRALEQELGFRATYFGGHSLGEYSALCAAGALPLASTVRLVRRRGALMQGAVPIGEGAMVAVIAEGIAERDLCSVLEGLDVDVANRNSAKQIVLSGPRASIERASARLDEHLKDVPHELVPLNVSAPFHSRMMRGIERELRAELEGLHTFVPEAAAVVVSNLHGGFHRPERASIIDALTRQVSGTVDWIANMHALCGVATEIYEVGPSRPLRGFFSTLGREVTTIVSVKAAERGRAA